MCWDSKVHRFLYKLWSVFPLHIIYYAPYNRPHSAVHFTQWKIIISSQFSFFTHIALFSGMFSKYSSKMAMFLCYQRCTFYHCRMNIHFIACHLSRIQKKIVWTYHEYGMTFQKSNTLYYIDSVHESFLDHQHNAMLYVARYIFYSRILMGK